MTLTVTTCYLFTAVEQDISIIESILARYKEAYSAFILDSQELNACLIPRLDDEKVEETPAQLVNMASIPLNPPDAFIVDTPILELGNDISAQYITHEQYKDRYMPLLQKTVVDYAKTNGMVTSIIFFTDSDMAPHPIKNVSL